MKEISKAPPYVFNVKRMKSITDQMARIKEKLPAVEPSALPEVAEKFCACREKWLSEMNGHARLNRDMDGRVALDCLDLWAKGIRQVVNLDAQASTESHWEAFDDSHESDRHAFDSSIYMHDYV